MNTNVLPNRQALLLLSPCSGYITSYCFRLQLCFHFQEVSKDTAFLVYVLPIVTEPCVFPLSASEHEGKLDRYSQMIVFISYTKFSCLGPHCSSQAPMAYTVTAGGLIKHFLTVLRDNIKFLQTIPSISRKWLILHPGPANRNVYPVLGKPWRFVLYPRMALYTSLSWTEKLNERMKNSNSAYRLIFLIKRWDVFKETQLKIYINILKGLKKKSLKKVFVFWGIFSTKFHIRPLYKGYMGYFWS